MNDRSKVIPNPEGETIGEVKEFAASERKQINVLTEGMENIEILGTIIQAFEPRFFEVCPQCGKRTRPEGDVYPCSVHGNITPDYSYVMNAFVDDGSENIRCVFFKNQVERLLGKTQPEILLYKEDLQAFDAIKTQLLGNIIKLVGRVTKNQMFDRLEFVTQLVFTDPDPKEELKKMETSSDSTPDVPDTVKTQEEEVVSDVEKLN